MNSKQPQTSPPGMTLPDVYFVLFRHKWKIICLSLLGIVAAGLVYVLMPALYSSEAELFVRYVVEAKLPTGMGSDPQVKTPDPGGASILNSEIEIIESLDLALSVADAVGAEKILGKGSGETNRTMAAAVIKKSLKVEVPLHSTILRIAFQHPNREIVQPVLAQLINAYLQQHVLIHQNLGGFDDLLAQQTDAARASLADAERELRTAQTNCGVMSVEDAKKAYTQEGSKIEEQIFKTEAELAERQVALKEHEKLLPPKGTTNSASAAAEAPIPPEKLEEYKGIYSDLESLRRREQDLRTTFTSENVMVRDVRTQIADKEKLLRNIEHDYPALARMQAVSSKPGMPQYDPVNEVIQIAVLQAGLKELKSQSEKVLAALKSVEEQEPAILALQRKKELEETKYKHFSSNLEAARFDEALDAGKTSYIKVVQTPSPPAREARQLVKTLAIIVASGVFGGIGLAFLIELFLDPTVRRPVEIETKLHLPLFLTIPEIRQNGHPKPAVPATHGKKQPPVAKPADGGGAATPVATTRDGAVAPLQAGNGLHLYCEALRDRLVTFFEIRNLTHKPKLIAVTGCGKGAGVTTLATGLAASLSETGDGNVLLVDMTVGQGAARPFVNGKPNCGLADALENDKRDTAMVQDNLYVVAENQGGNGSGLPRILPRRFKNLMPQLKASDYDYIIFDMPPVNQLSVTPRLAGFMDMVLLVIESEKTDRDIVRRASEMLAESKANVAAVLNKNHPYVPRRLQQDL
jgi:uncharacterized protein involved in exopolysaccharide biosynthesis/Mrp family chromosome partitioning ATPase